jgi:hypothetical protein
LSAAISASMSETMSFRAMPAPGQRLFPRPRTDGLYKKLTRAWRAFQSERGRCGVGGFKVQVQHFRHRR